jgi:hypothetical protein
MTSILQQRRRAQCGCAFLAPEIVTAILNGKHPPRLTANRLMDDTRLPLDWVAQRELFRA